MQIKKNTVVSLTYELLDADGALIEKTDAPVSYLHGGHDGIFARVQQASPSPYEFLLQLGDEQLVGASPEMFVRIEGQRGIVVGDRFVELAES